MVGSVVFTPSWYNPDTGSIRWASISANEVPVNGDGYLARLHFKALKAGYTTLVFTDVPRGSGQDLMDLTTSCLTIWVLIFLSIGRTGS